MNYELAKKLKDAGFPQRRGCSACLTGFAFDGNFTEEKIGEDYVSRPTLSELIEACGDDLESITNRPEVLDRTWICLSKTYDSSFGMKGTRGDCMYKLELHGKTPEEAVANLYLALHE